MGMEVRMAGLLPRWELEDLNVEVLEVGRGLVKEVVFAYIKIHCPDSATGAINPLIKMKKTALSHRLICLAAADHERAAESRLPCTAFNLELPMRSSELKHFTISVHSICTA